MMKNKFYIITSDSSLISELQSDSQLISSIDKNGRKVNKIELNDEVVSLENNYDSINSYEMIIIIEVVLEYDWARDSRSLSMPCMPIMFIKKIYIDSDKNKNNFNYNIESLVFSKGFEVEYYNVENKGDFGQASKLTFEGNQHNSGKEIEALPPENRNSIEDHKKIEEKIGNASVISNNRSNSGAIHDPVSSEVDSNKSEQVDISEILKNGHNTSNQQSSALEDEIQNIKNDTIDQSFRMASAIIFGLNNFRLRTTKIDYNFDKYLFQLVEWILGDNLDNCEGNKSFNEITKDIERLICEDIEYRNNSPIFQKKRSSERSVWHSVLSIISINFKFEKIPPLKKAKKETTNLDELIFSGIVKEVLKSPFGPNSAASKLDNIFKEVINDYEKELPKGMTSFHEESVKVVKYSEGINELKDNYPSFKRTLASIIYISSDSLCDYQMVKDRQKLIKNHESIFFYWFLFGLQTGYSGFNEGFVSCNDKHKTPEKWGQLFNLISKRLFSEQGENKLIHGKTVLVPDIHYIEKNGSYKFSTSDIIPNFKISAIYHGNTDKIYRKLVNIIKNIDSDYAKLDNVILDNADILGLKEWPCCDDLFKLKIVFKGKFSQTTDFGSKQSEICVATINSKKDKWSFNNRERFYEIIEDDKYVDRIKKIIIKTESAWSSILNYF